MNFADLDVRYLRALARWDKSFNREGDHFVLLIRKDLPRPSSNPAADENEPRNADSRTCYQAREAKRDSEGQENRPRRASRHLDELPWALFRIPNIHHDVTVL
jgi:hypothetical protein